MIDLGLALGCLSLIGPDTVPLVQSDGGLSLGPVYQYLIPAIAALEGVGQSPPAW